MIRLIIFCVVGGCVIAYLVPEQKDYHWEHQETPNYDVSGLNRLISTLGQHSSLTDKQAKAYAAIYGITKADLESGVDIFGEKTK